MRLPHSIALLLLAFATSTLASQADTASGLSPALLVDPATVAVKQTIASLALDRWKLSRPTREMLSENIDSINRDIAETLPGLVAGASGTPPAPPALLLLTRNLAALYEVLLRVTVIAEGSAPKDQMVALEHALAKLQAARHALEDQAETSSADQARQIAELRKALASARMAPVVAPPAATPLPCQPPRKRKIPAKPASS